MFAEESSAHPDSQDRSPELRGSFNTVRGGLPAGDPVEPGAGGLPGKVESGSVTTASTSHWAGAGGSGFPLRGGSGAQTSA